MSGNEPPADRNSDAGTGLSVLAALSVTLAALIVLPYLQYVLLAVVLAYVLAPAQRFLEHHTSSTRAALVLITLAVFVVLLPLAYVLTVALQQGLNILASIQDGSVNLDMIQERLAAVGYVVDIELLYETYQQPIETGLQRLATGALTVIGGLPGVLVGITVTLFVLFTLLRDGERLLDWLREVLPVEERVQRDLLLRLDRLMWASVVGNVAVAAVQAVLLAVGLLAVGVPGIVFLTVATFVLTLLPLVGAFGVWLPAAGYLLALGRPLAAVGLVVYGLLVSASDIYLRPALIGRSGAINVAIIVVGIFGGLVLFGAVGLFVGPVVLAGAKVVLDLYARERGGSAPQ